MRFPYSHDGYAELGLSGNPFIAEGQPSVPDDLWIARAGVPDLPEPGDRRLIQIIGVKGAGKTSLLLHWRGQRPGPYHYVAPGRVRWQVPPIGPLVYWDEVDRLAGPVRAFSFGYAAARSATIVAGTHADLSRPAKVAGLRVTTFEYPMLTPTVLQQWVQRRIEAVTVPGRTPSLILDEHTAAELCTRVGPSLREAAIALHRWAAEEARRTGTDD